MHGFPETKRIWARNVAPLAAAGFDVIVPDLRGVGDSDPAPDGFFDPPAYARDLRALCAALGIERCGAVAGDVGAMVVAELGLRFPGFVERQCLFNTLAPPLVAAFAAAGIPEDPPVTERPEMDYFVRQGSDADGLLAELDTPERRRAYVARCTRERGWAAPGSFTRERRRLSQRAVRERRGAARGGRGLRGRVREAADVRAARARAGESGPDADPLRPRGSVVTPHFPARMAVAFPNHAGPFEMPARGTSSRGSSPRRCTAICARSFAISAEACRAGGAEGGSRHSTLTDQS